MIKHIGILIVLALNTLTFSFADTSVARLTKNPFIKPNFIETTKNEVSGNVDRGEVLTDRNLRATLSSKKGSIANIDGMMIFVGEQVKGYTLISVGEGSATFVKNEKQITLNVSELHKKLK